MTPMKKPDWFQMAEADGPRPVRSIKRGARIAALVAPLLLVGVGVVVAQSNDGRPASAVETQSPSNQITQNSNSAITSQTIQNVEQVPATLVSAPATSAIAIKAPTGKADDDALPITQISTQTKSSPSLATKAIKAPTGKADDEDDALPITQISTQTKSSPSLATKPSSPMIQKPVGGGEDDEEGESDHKKKRFPRITNGTGSIQPPTGRNSDDEGFEGEDD